MDLRQRLERLTAKRTEEVPPSGSGTTERLKRLLESSPRGHASRRTDDAEVSERLGGTVLQQGVVLVETWLPLNHVHGRVPLSRLMDAPLEALAPASPRPEELLFLDTETTGLAGGTGTLPFLLGLARVEKARLSLRQYFLTGFAGEAALLEHARDWLAAGRHLVSYNGKSFDIPLLLTRHRLRRLAWPLEGKPHLDLLHPTRAAFGTLWPDCRLQRAEAELLGLARTDDLPGAMVPQVWGDFVRTGIMGEVPRILKHNHLDIVTLAVLAGELARVHANPGYCRADAHALARGHLRRGLHGEALAHLRADRADLDNAGLLELARLYRRQGNWEEGVAIWKALAGDRVTDAILALAKYHEHVTRDYRQAAACCLELIALEPGEPAHRHRHLRLMRKSMCDQPIGRGRGQEGGFAVDGGPGNDKLYGSSGRQFGLPE